jgi:uncharacterized protein (TIGR01777 family)
MRVFITGGSGLIGRNLANTLRNAGHHPLILTRNAAEVKKHPEMWPFAVVQGDPTTPGSWEAELKQCDAVVNLAGHSVFANRWNTEVKAKIRDSRVKSAETIAGAMSAADCKAKVLVQASAIGYYGPRGDETLDESSPAGDDFLATVCKEVEAASSKVTAAGVRQAIVRVGIVLARGEGALKIMTPIFMNGPGAPIGSNGGFVARGEQWMSWIHIDDIVGIFQLALDDSRASGTINGTAPNPATNAEFAKTFSTVLRKPYTPWRFSLPFGVPDAALRLVLGEVATVITKGQKVVPAKALTLGYAFKHPFLEEALRALFAEEVGAK